VDPDRDDAVRLRRGDLAGLTGLMGRHQEKVFRYLVRLLGDETVAEDVFQQTWLRAAERIARYDASRPFAPWLLAVARNLALDHLRRYRPESLDDGEGAAAPTGASTSRANPSRALRAANGASAWPPRSPISPPTTARSWPCGSRKTWPCTSWRASSASPCRR